MVDDIVPPGYFSNLRHLPNDKLLNQYNTTLARQVEMGSQLREKHIRNLEALLKAEVDMKGSAEAKNVELAKELESLRVQFSDLQVSNNQLSQQVSTLQAQIMDEERIKAAFEEFKKYEDGRVSSRCAKIDARLDALSVDFNEELYPHMMTAIVSCRWIIGHGLRLAIMKCAESTELRQVFANVVFAGIAKGMDEGLKHEVEHGKAKEDLAAIEAYDPKANTKYVAALHALKDLKYPLVDRLEKLKDALIDLKIPVYPEVRNPKDPWSFKDKILLEDAIAANVSRAKKKKKCRVVCHTHGVSFAYHTRSDGVPVSVPIVAPQGLAILLADAATQIEIIEDEASPRLVRSKFLPPLYNLDRPASAFLFLLDLAYGKVSEATDQAFGLLKVNFVPSGLVSISPAPDPSTYDDPSVNNVHGSCRVLITDAPGGASSGFPTRKSARIRPFTDVRGQDGSCKTASVLSGHRFIPSGFIMYPRNIPSAAPNLLYLYLDCLGALQGLPPFFCLTGVYPSGILSRCSIIDRGTPAMSDGCHANISKFLFKSVHSFVHTFIDTVPSIVISWSGKVRMYDHFKIFVTYFSLFCMVFRCCCNGGTLSWRQDSTTDSHYSALHREFEHSVSRGWYCLDFSYPRPSNDAVVW
nr:hypothetical protein [Tanacetum cinerariifolium]